MDSATRKQLRMERNRQSAAASRERKRLQLEEKEKEVEILQAEIQQLRQRCETLEEQNTSLRQQLLLFGSASGLGSGLSPISSAGPSPHVPRSLAFALLFAVVFVMPFVFQQAMRDYSSLGRSSAASAGGSLSLLSSSIANDGLAPLVRALVVPPSSLVSSFSAAQMPADAVKETGLIVLPSYLPAIPSMLTGTADVTAADAAEGGRGSMHSSGIGDGSGSCSCSCCSSGPAAASSGGAMAMVSDLDVHSLEMLFTDSSWIHGPPSQQQQQQQQQGQEEEEEFVSEGSAAAAAAAATASAGKTVFLWVPELRPLVMGVSSSAAAPSSSPNSAAHGRIALIFPSNALQAGMSSMSPAGSGKRVRRSAAASSSAVGGGGGQDESTRFTVLSLPASQFKSMLVAAREAELLKGSREVSIAPVDTVDADEDCRLGVAA